MYNKDNREIYKQTFLLIHDIEEKRQVQIEKKHIGASEEKWPIPRRYKVGRLRL